MRRPYKPSPVVTSGDDAFIYLNNGGVAIVDAEKNMAVAPWAWRAHPNGAGNVYASTRIDGKTVFLHRFVMGSPAGQKIDHRDGDGLNCRKGNLRPATNEQNAMNSRSRKPGFKGVHRHTARNLWYAEIQHHGQRVKMPYRRTPEAAAMDYDEAARSFHGEFANVNFPVYEPAP